jgi:hypothetical protein
MGENVLEYEVAVEVEEELLAVVHRVTACEISKLGICVERIIPQPEQISTK